MRINNLRIEGAMEFLRQLAVEKPLYLVMGTLILILWGFEKWVFSVSSWVPILASVWATIQYASHQHQIVVEDLNRKWKRVVLESSPITSVEHCEWLNKLLTEIWPNFFSPMLSKKLPSIVEKRLRDRIPSFIEKIEIQKFSLGSSPPTLALDGIRWSTFGDEKNKMMHLGVKWDTQSCNIVLVAKLVKPLKGTARIVINNIHIKGDLQVIPILEGKAILYSFLAAPLVKINVAIGSGSSQSLPATDLPAGVSSWLGKLLSDTLAKTTVEPRRRCLPLPTVKTGKKAVACVIHVTVVGANHIYRTSFKGSPSKREQSYSTVTGASTSSQDENSVSDLHTLVEVQLEQLTRRTHVKQGSNPTWNSTFNMVFHNSSGILKFRLYECNPASVKYDYLACFEIKLRYCEDDSTIFWAIGPDSTAITKQVGISCEEVEMTVPFEGSNSGETTVRLVLQEWQFSDDSQSFHLSTPSVNGSSNIPATTGRKVHVTVAEAKNLARKDKSGKINPYVRLHYGKTVLRTRTVSDGVIPEWNKKFEFEELGGGEYLTLRCYSEDTFGDEHIGSARVNLERLIDGSVKEEWIPLEKVNSGDIRLLMEAVRIDNNELPKGPLGGTINGWIELVLIEAKDLVGADLRGTSDPYVKVQYGNLKKRTKVVYRTLNPHWNQTLEFADDGGPLLLYVKDHNDILAPSNIGECEIEYQRLPLNQTYDKWIPLQGVTKGEIHVQITRKVPQVLDKRTSLDSDSSLHTPHNIASKMKQLLIKLQALAGEGDQESISETVSELETFQGFQEEYIQQLEADRCLLLNKVAVLDEDIAFSPPSSGQSPATLTR